jgi:hypothetical protein
MNELSSWTLSAGKMTHGSSEGLPSALTRKSLKIRQNTDCYKVAGVIGAQCYDKLRSLFTTVRRKTVNPLYKAIFKLF